MSGERSQQGPLKFSCAVSQKKLAILKGLNGSATISNDVTWEIIVIAAHFINIQNEIINIILRKDIIAIIEKLLFNEIEGVCFICVLQKCCSESYIFEQF